MKKIKVIGKILCLSSALSVVVFFTYYIMASIKLGEFATVESNNNPFYDKRIVIRRIKDNMKIK